MRRGWQLPFIWLGLFGEPLGLTMTDEPDDNGAERRAFLKAAGKFAVTVPPAMTFLLTTSLQSNAIASSNGQTTPITSNSAAIDDGDSATTTTYSTSTAHSPRQRLRGVSKH
jgi:hypothetical protein